MTKNPQVWFTSDTHIGHRFMARDRGFILPNKFEEHRGQSVPMADVEAHDASLADMWDSQVRENDTVFVLGDISINGSAHALKWHAKRPGKKILIMGNHDPVWPFNRDAYKYFSEWSEVFEAMFPFLRRKLGGHYFLMSHFPYTGTGSEGHGAEERATQFRLPDMGLPLIHGHTHDADQRSHISDNGTPQLHVGLDAWDQKLIHQDTIQGWLENPTSTFYQ